MAVTAIALGLLIIMFSGVIGRTGARHFDRLFGMERQLGGNVVRIVWVVFALLLIVAGTLDLLGR